MGHLVYDDDDVGDDTTPPDDCDWCGAPTDDLVRFFSKAPRDRVIWACVFCRNFMSPWALRNRNLAVMGNILLRAITASNNGSD